ncbi:hypothetical protein RCO27_08410 [Sphingosinicella sp. LHD-64]|uniref:hypothetical protein n=1 Tax=Sphingosinicella sp. LHD-64 TaxID=3072139 RepID=UPI00280CD00E|nr:hypothetical protein [Sphingosinicella sp. LHD-64]MDQ8756252.1 hypothetical protein [Sphingosinicella sp. LHD-64]
MLSKKLAALAALSLMTASTVAHAQSAQSLSVASAAPRAGADTQDANQMAGGAGIWVIGAIVLGLAIWGIIELTDDDEPSSP